MRLDTSSGRINSELVNVVDQAEVKSRALGSTPLIGMSPSRLGLQPIGKKIEAGLMDSILLLQ
jgi:hypothetical protein